MRMSMLPLKIMMICSSVTVWELPVEKKFSTITYSFPQVFPQVCGKLNDFEPIPQLSVPSWPIWFPCLMLDSFNTQHHEHLHWERLRQPQGVSGWTSWGVRFGYGQHPDHGSSCVRRLRWSCDCTGRCNGRLLNWHTGDCGSPWSLLHYICTWKTHEQRSSHHSLQGRYITDSEDVSSFDCSSFCCFPFSLIYLFTTHHHHATS